MSLRTVRVPDGIAPMFEEAEALVSRYFQLRRDDPEHGTLEVFGERYVLVRAASLSVEFFKLCEDLFGAGKEQEASEFARNILFDLAHAIGKSDAQNFHAKMGLVDPIAKLSAGPIHFAHTGWAFVDISPESNTTLGDDFCLVYDHPYSFEADAWMRSGKKHDFPVCIMNAGYSSGWTEESFGVQLVSAELECRARGDERCHFVMAQPHRIAQILERHPRARTSRPPVPDFFSRKRMEDELRRAHDDLEKRVAERTEELRVQMRERERIERQLRQVHKLEAVGRLAGGVAHDFNNLVAIVLGNCSVLQSRLPPDDKNQQLLDDVLAACRRASDLTKQLLAFGRTQQQVRERIDLRVLVADTARMLAPLLGEDIELVVESGADAACVEADRTQLDQVVVNLALNARDAMPDGGKLVIGVDLQTIAGARAAELQMQPGRYVRLLVRDEGVGIDDATLQQIFDPFFTTKERGSGMGLSTVYGVVRQSGGGIAVETKLGDGTTFEIFLPEAAAPPESARTGDRPVPNGGSETILVVEDQAALRRVIALILRDLGYQVLVADDPDGAVRLAREHTSKLHLVLTDVVMPKANGPETAARVLELHPDARVLYMSGYAEERVLDRAGVQKKVPWLAKPFGADDLARKVREVLDAAL